MKTPLTFLAPLLALFLLATSARVAAAGRAVVLRVDKSDVYVNVGVDDGVGVGSVLTLLHVVKATHPVTKKAIRDLFPIGDLRVVNVGRRVSVARAADGLLPRVAVGDEVELQGEPRTLIDPWETRSRVAGNGGGAAAGELGMRSERERKAGERARKVAEARVAAETAARDAWQTTLGKPPADRIAVWKEYLAAHPGSRYVSAVEAEIASLREQMETHRTPSASVEEYARVRDELEELVGIDDDVLPDGPLLALLPRRVYEGAPFDLAFLVLPRGSVGDAWVYYRSRGDATYQRAQLRPDGDGYLRQRIPGAMVSPPYVEYFVEIVRGDKATAQPVIGSAEMPQRITVDVSVEVPPPDVEGRSRVTLFVDYVDFDGAGRAFDQYLHAEIDFMYRFRRPIHSLRLGFGAIGGKGGPKDVIDADPEGCLEVAGDPASYRCRRVNLHYGYLELEHRVNDVVSFMVRPLAGSAWRDPRREEGLDREFFSAVGLRTRLRLGHETGTNLVLGVQLIEQLGSSLEGVFTWDVVPHFPIVLSAIVTDQPVPEDFGVRLVADVGWRGPSWVVPSLRLSYQARDLDHAGYGGGLALNFDW
jgi:hypothetical protein